MKFLKTILILFFGISIHGIAQVEGMFIDLRDSTTYKTVTYTIKNKDKAYEITWMAENLNYNLPNSFCVDDDTSNCLKYGRLYTWFEAQKACPAGWHLPSDEDWNNLADLYEGLERAGKHLKAQGENKGSNKSLFNGQLGGSRDPMDRAYYKVGKAGFFWSSTESINNPDEASDWSFASWSDQLRHWEGGKFIGNSCRCIKN